MNSNFISINHSVSRETASIRNIHTITSVAILAAISFALAFLSFLFRCPLPSPRWTFPIFLRWLAL